MPCPSCRSSRQSVFPAEANIHFPGREGLDKATVWVFPQMWEQQNALTPPPKEVSQGLF